MKQYNYKSDFKFYPNFTNNGNTVSIPSCDFDINLISKYTIYTASRRGNVYSNCKLVDGKLLVICDNHRLSVGTINIEFIAYIPDTDFPDGDKKTVNLATDQIELVLGNGDDLTQVDITLALNYAVIECYDVAVKYGYTGTKEEFYTALIATPTVIPQAQQAISDLNALNTTVAQNEETRKGNETTRINAENNRDNNETSRVNEETARKSNESERVSSEETRVGNETDRKFKESERVSNETTRITNENGRVSKESERQTNENTRKSNEDSRALAETTRSDNETARKSNETDRVTAENNRVVDEIARINAELSRVSEFNQIKTDAETATNNANDAADNADNKANSANTAAINANNAASGANAGASVATDAATAANAAAQAAQTAAASIAAQTFTGLVYTNPFTASKSPRRLGDIAVNSTTLEIWQAINTTNAAASWTRINAGIYGGTLATDLNAINLSGFITILSTGLNVPNANENWYVNHINSNSGTVYAYQVAVGFTTGDKYWRTKINSVWGSWTKEEHFTTAYKNQVDTNASDIAELKLGSGYYYISGWDSSLSATPVVSKGNQTWARDISHVNLFDMSQNTGQAMHPIGELQRANYLRYIDGTFAPTVGITEAMRAACDVALYLDAAHTNLYSAAGSFNATTFYNTYGMNQKLYDASGNEVRILRPWETTSTNYHIGQSFSEKVWVIDGIGNSGLYWQGLAQHDITWDGVKGVPLERTAISPCPSTTVGGKMRNFFFLYNAGDSNTASSAGQSGLCTIFSGMNRTFPRVNDISQISNMNFARANNSVTANPYPVAEGGYHALNAAIIRREILFGTRYLHNPSLFGSGISSNDTCNSEATFLANGGFKYKIHTDSAWNYGTFGITPTMCYNNAGGTTNASVWLSNYYPKEQCMESQLAASFAKETGVSPNTDFSFYGATYQYRNVTGVLGLADGRMNVIVTKVLSQTISAFNSSGAATSYDIACCLRMSLIDGMNLSGDIFRYFGGGYEQVGTCASTVQPHTGDIINIYLQPDQKSWLNITDVTKNNLGVFDFEKTYNKLGTTTNLGDNYAKTRMPLSAWKTSIGGSLSTGQCYYAWDNDYWSIIINQRVRIAARFGGSAGGSICCARTMDARDAISYAYTYYSGSAQVLVN